MVVAALRYELGGEHTFEFVEGVVPCAIFPGMLIEIWNS